MRKSLVILTALISFALGLASQSLFAGGGDPNYAFPAQGSPPPRIESCGYFSNNGWTIYRLPDGWKLFNVGESSLGNVSVQLKKKRTL